MRNTFYARGLFKRKFYRDATPSAVLCPLCHQPSLRLYQVTVETAWPPSGMIPAGWRHGCFKCRIVFIPPWSRKPTPYSVPPPSREEG